MSLPPGFLDELRSRTSLARIVGRKVSWDMRKSNQGKGDMWAPCPFHQEKTASFHVDDRKGFYYCFGCHAKGDAITFLRESENMEFMEAVELLAREAGMQMPAPDPRARERADRQSQLVGAMEAAVQHYRLQLRTHAGAAARDYMAGRGLDDAALERWGIGFAPDQRRGLFEHLTGKGIAASIILEAGLAAAPEDGGQPYDRFRGRIIFPIRDGRGRTIALGGRAMSADARAKYLNSPETPIFDKGRSLFNIDRARAALGDGAPLIVAEGYMDVIALAEAGFEASVAPLGTAITEHQLAMLWRLHPEPVIALDGDKAGLRAAMRLIDIAMPMLEPGRSLRFALLPEGQDPDDLLKAGGPAEMSRLIEAAHPLVQLLWRRETEGRIFDSPERRAGLDKALREAISKIRDRSVRSHYASEINRLRQELFRPAGAGRMRGAQKKWPARFDRRGGFRTGGGSWDRALPGFAEAAPQPDTRGSYLANMSSGAGALLSGADHLREAVILGVLIRNPELIERFAGELEDLELLVPLHQQIMNALLRLGPGQSAGDATETDAPGREAGREGAGQGDMGAPASTPAHGGAQAERAAQADPAVAQSALERELAEAVGAKALEKLFSLRPLQVIPAICKPGDTELAALTLAQELAKLEAFRGAAREIADAAHDLEAGQASRRIMGEENVTWRLKEAARARNEALRSALEEGGDFESAANGAPISRSERDAFEELLRKIGSSGRS